MDIKREIECFRSQALMGRYANAIKLGKCLIENLGILERVLNHDISPIKKEIQSELEYCIQLSSFIEGGQKKQHLQHIPKIIENQKVEGLSKNQQSKKWKSFSTDQFKNQSHLQNVNLNALSEESETIQQKIHKNIILPLNMPVFKLKSSIFLVRTRKCLSQVLQYLLHYDFKQFPTVHLCDLGVQNIVLCKQEMQIMGEKRVLIALQNQNNQTNEFGKKQIEKLKNIIQVYRQTYEKAKVENNQVLAFVVEENSMNMSENPSTLNSIGQKSVYFQ